MKEISDTGDGLPETGFVRRRQFLGPGKPIPIGVTKWYKGIRAGDYPPPIKLAANLSVWRVQDIRALIERLGAQGGADASK